MKFFTKLGKHTVIMTESQVKTIQEEIKVATAKEKDANTHTMQADFKKFKKCPKCGAQMPFLMSVYDEEDGKPPYSNVIGTIDEKGKWKPTEFQAYGIWRCPKCFYVEAESNMA